MAYTIHSTVGKVMSNPQAKAVIEKHLPGASTHPQLQQGWHITLGELTYYPESGVTAAKLQAILGDLAAVPEA